MPVYAAGGVGGVEDGGVAAFGIAWYSFHAP
jgi:hypothetical protein